VEITREERGGRYASVRFLNHEWDNPAALRRIGTLSPKETDELSGGLFSMEAPVDINTRLFDYDEVRDHRSGFP